MSKSRSGWICELGERIHKGHPLHYNPPSMRTWHLRRNHDPALDTPAADQRRHWGDVVCHICLEQAKVHTGTDAMCELLWPGYFTVPSLPYDV